MVQDLLPTVNLAAIGASTQNTPLWYRQHYSDAQPFTYRSGLTFEEVLENIRTWIPETLLPYFNDTLGGLKGDIDTLSAAFDTAIQNALNAITASDVNITDPIIATALQAINSQSRAWLDNRYALYDASNPSGGDDTATLQALLIAAQTTNGLLRLRPGTYKANLVSNQSVAQPRIQGASRDRTKLQALANTSPALKLKGGSGSLGGGFLSDFEIAATDAGGGIGLQLADTNGVTWSRLRFSGTLDYAIEFYNEAALGFTEYNFGDADIKSSVKTGIHYKRSAASTAESFHGSGVVQGTLINQVAGASTPMVLIESNCFPYNAPMTMAVFPRNSNVPIIRNLNTGRKVSFYGHLDIEVQGGASNIDVADRNYGIVYYAGTPLALQTGDHTKLGNFYLVDKIHYNGGNTFVQLRPYQVVATLGTGSTTIGPTQMGSGMYNVEIKASNYHYSFTLMCWQSPYDPTGTVTILSTNKSLNTAGFGAPTFAWTNYGLVITNAAYPSTGVTAYIHVIPIQTSISDDKLGQL